MQSLVHLSLLVFWVSKFLPGHPKLSNDSLPMKHCYHQRRLKTLSCYWSIDFYTMHVVSFIIYWLNYHFAIWPNFRAVCEIGEYWFVLCGIEWIIRTNPLVAHQTIIHWTNLFFEFCSFFSQKDRFKIHHKRYFFVLHFILNRSKRKIFSCK